jgi:hypothetical protein
VELRGLAEAPRESKTILASAKSWATLFRAGQRRARSGIDAETAMRRTEFERAE